MITPEAQSYVDIRDGFLAQAREVTSGPRLDRAWIATQAVESFLPSMDPADAERERAKCDAAKAEIDRLRTSARAWAPAAAAASIAATHNPTL